MDIMKALQGGFSEEMRKEIWNTITVPLTEEMRNKIRDEISGKELKFPNPEFNENNLRFDIDYLNQIGGVICMLPLEFMADYVDGVCKSSMDENDGLMEENVLSTELSDEQISQMNATSLGNTAYIILHTKNEMARHKCLDVLHRYLNFYLDNLMNIIGAQINMESNL